MASRIPKRLMVASTTMAVIVAASSVGATGLMLGADQGHANLTNNGCKIAPIGLTPAVACSDPLALIGQYLWHIPLPTPAASATATSLTPSVFAKASVNNPTTARLIAWNASGVLTCATATVTWPNGSAASSKSLLPCSKNWQANRAEIEVWLAHVPSLTGNDPEEGKVWSVTYTY